MLGMAIAVVGGVLNFLGWYVFDSRVLSLAGFYIAVVGTVFGGAAIVVWQVFVIGSVFRK